MKLTRFILVSVVSLSLLTACGSSSDIPEDVLDVQLNQIMAAKTRFAVSKTATPVLNTHDWDFVFGGADGKTLKYDRYGEVDEVVFVALPGTFFNTQREIRKETRKGVQTIYYKVTTPQYNGSEELWVDGRFLDLRDIKPQEEIEPATAAKTLIALRSYEGLPFTWHGSSNEGASDLLLYYPPSEELTAREKDDWILKGFDSLGMLYQASKGATPIDASSLGEFGKPVTVDLGSITVEDDANDDPNVLRLAQAKALMAALKPLDIISMGERTWIVLDRSEVIESRYRSKFDGEVQVNSLLDTAFGLLQKGLLVKNPYEEVTDPDRKPFFIRRYADTSSLFVDQLTEDEQTSSDEPSDEDVKDDTNPSKVIFTQADPSEKNTNDPQDSEDTNP